MYPKKTKVIYLEKNDIFFFSIEMICSNVDDEIVKVREREVPFNNKK